MDGKSRAMRYLNSLFLFYYGFSVIGVELMGTHRCFFFAVRGAFEACGYAFVQESLSIIMNSILIDETNFVIIVKEHEMYWLVHLY